MKFRGIEVRFSVQPAKRIKSPHRSDREHRELTHLAITAVFSLVIAILLQLGLSHGSLAMKDINDITIFWALGVIIGELYPILRASLRLDYLFSRNEKILRQVTTKNNVANSLTHTVLRSFDFADEPAHAAVTASIKSFLRTVEIEEDAISLRGDYLARELYENFWTQLVEAQLSARGKNPPVRVYVTHSASVRLWDTDQFAAIRQKQEEFRILGGEIVRVFLHEPGSIEKRSDYSAVISRMRKDRVLVYYLDMQKTPSSFRHDYLLTSFGGQYYAMTWFTDWARKGSFGNLSGCKVRIGLDRFEHDYWPMWVRIVEALELTKDADYGDPVLNVRPADDQFDEMKSYDFSERDSDDPAPAPRRG